MRIEKYQVLKYATSVWHFDEIELQSLNLLVGDSGTGKTRLLNTVFNGATAAVRPEVLFPGHWRWLFSQKQKHYRWEVKVKNDTGKPEIEAEDLFDETDGRSLVERRGSDFRFLGNELPKLSRHSTAISLLKDEALIKPVHDAFSSIMRRRFFSDDLERAYKDVALDADRFGGPGMSLKDIFLIDQEGAVNIKAYALSRFQPRVWQSVVGQFRNVFPFVDDVQVQDLKRLKPGLQVPGFVPAICLREKHVKAMIPAEDISSGMQKVLLILMDLALLPSDGVYLLDEYENSLGISAINFLPDLLLERTDSCQFLVTSHHPYIINKVSPEHWYVFHRQGSDVRIRFGQENAERYGKSKQQRFIQLLNDPFFQGGAV